MANLQFVAPSFIVSDIKTATAFYTEKLGFEIRFTDPDHGDFFAIVGRDDIMIFLKAVAPEIKPVPNRTRHEYAPWDAYVSVNDPDALYKEFATKGVQFFAPLNNSGGLRGFEVMDADGYILYFGKVVE